MKIDLSYIKHILCLWYFSYIVACTAVAQSLVPKNFTISTLVYIMCDKETWFWFGTAAH